VASCSPYAGPFTRAIQLAIIEERGALAEEKKFHIFGDALKALARILGSFNDAGHSSHAQPLPGSSLVLLLPILRLSLTYPRDATEDCFENAVHVLANQCALVAAQDDPHDQPTEILLDLILLCLAGSEQRKNLASLVQKSISAFAQKLDVNSLTPLFDGRGLKNPHSMVRQTSLQAISRIKIERPYPLKMVYGIFIAGHDVEQENASAAKSIWEKFGMNAEDESFLPYMLSSLVHPEDCIRTSAATALAEVLTTFPAKSQTCLSEMIERFQENRSIVVVH